MKTSLVAYDFGILQKKLELRASPIVLYYKPESRKKWKYVNCDSGQEERSLYSSVIYRLKPGFGKSFKGACNRFWNVLLWKGTQVWEIDVLMITELQAYKTTGDAQGKDNWGCSR
jgi:hypothetical protein